MRSPAASGAVDRCAVTEHLPGWDYADAYECDVAGNGPDCALTAARSLLQPSTTARRVLRLRDLLVRAWSLRPAVTGGADLFPVLSTTPELAVLGLDDRHLDFRILVAVEEGRVCCTTAVRRHNVLGRGYFAVVGPCHRLIVPRLLARSARRGWVRTGVDWGPAQPQSRSRPDTPR
jgi:hypothetical protein